MKPETPPRVILKVMESYLSLKDLKKADGTNAYTPHNISSIIAKQMVRDSEDIRSIINEVYKKCVKEENIPRYMDNLRDEISGLNDVFYRITVLRDGVQAGKILESLGEAPPEEDKAKFERLRILTGDGTAKKFLKASEENKVKIKKILDGFNV